MKFKKDFLLELMDDNLYVYDKIRSHGRWSVRHEWVFAHEGKFYKSFYSVGATEYQDESPYEYDGDEIECPEVMPVEKTIIVYEVVKALEDTEDA